MYQIVMLGKKNIGMYNSDKNTFIKHGVKKSRHLMQKLDAWGVDENTFKNILKPGARIIVEEVEERKRYEATKEMFESLGSYLNFGGFGLQIFLPREHWTITKM